MDSFIDFHTHITINSKTANLYPNYTFPHFLEEQRKANVHKSVCFINPFVSDILCDYNAKHKIMIEDSSCAGRVKIRCTECNRILYEGVDPLRKYNEALLNFSTGINSVIPFVYLNVCESNISQEIEYYETKYPNTIKGYKIHPTFSGRSILDLSDIPTDKPIVVHTGVEPCANPLNVIQFSKRHSGPLVMAHFARFHRDALHALNECKNLFVDTSPMIFLHQLQATKPHRVFDISWFASRDTPLKLFYQKLLKCLPPEKIVLATDAPFSSLSDEVAFIRELFNGCDETVYYNAQKLL